MTSESLQQIATQLTRIFVPVIIVVSVVSNSLNIILLSRPALINHACSLYFIALAITNLFYSSLPLIFNLLADGYHLDVTHYSSGSCKVISYLLNYCPTLSVYLIVLASIDRYFASSINVRRRNWSSLRVARWAIGILVALLAIFFINTLIVFDTSSKGVHVCTLRSDILFNQIFLVTNLILYAIIAPLSMIFFGFLTIYNTKQVRFLPVRVSRYRRTEGQLSRMLLLQVGTHLILTLPFCVVFTMLLSPIPTRFWTAYSFAYVICKIPFYMTTTVAFFLYVLSARVYRDELVQLSKRLVRLRHTLYFLTTQQTILSSSGTRFSVVPQRDSENNGS